MSGVAKTDEALIYVDRAIGQVQNVQAIVSTDVADDDVAEALNAQSQSVVESLEHAKAILSQGQDKIGCTTQGKYCTEFADLRCLNCRAAICHDCWNFGHHESKHCTASTSQDQERSEP